MQLTNADKRVLELWFTSFYLWYTTNNTQHNFTHFLMLPELLQTNTKYDAELIQIVWKDHLLDNFKIPNEDEMLLAMVHKSKNFQCSTHTFNPFYKLKGKNRRAKLLSFRNIKVTLTPKIHNEKFHENLLEFIKQLHYTFGNIRHIFKENNNGL